MSKAKRPMSDDELDILFEYDTVQTGPRQPYAPGENSSKSLNPTIVQPTHGYMPSGTADIGDEKVFRDELVATDAAFILPYALDHIVDDLAGLVEKSLLARNALKNAHSHPSLNNAQKSKIVQMYNKLSVLETSVHNIVKDLDRLTITTA